jgi:hypothetical protein
MMRGMKIFFAACMAILCATQVFASVDMFMGFDVTTQEMVTVIRSDQQLVSPNILIGQTNEGFVDSLHTEACCVIKGGRYEYWYSVPLATYNPVSRLNVERGDFNEITATVQEGTFPVGTRNDILMADIDTLGHDIYTYPALFQGTCIPIVPDTIRIGSQFCANICHGSYTIPIFCEDPNYRPELLQITVTNGCEYNPPLGHCDVACEGIDWTLFAYNLRVRSNCRINLIMSYCGENQGCVCIWRSDYRLNAEVSSFSAIAGDGNVRINWNTASETDNAQFRITRSENKDGVYNTVYSRPGAGTSSDAHSYEWVDQTALNGHTYYYKLNTIDVNSNAHTYETIVNATPLAGSGIVKEFKLEQNYPNPFNSETSFTFSIPEDEFVSLKVYDLLGREVATIVDQQMTARSYNVNWSAKDLSTGVYMYTLTAGQNTETKKLLYLK